MDGPDGFGATAGIGTKLTSAIEVCLAGLRQVRESG